MNIDSIIKKIIEKRTPCVFISPHLDDAALSAGELILRLASKTDVTIATVFTEAPPPPYTLSAKVFLKKCGGYENAEDLFSLRRKEDIAACRALGADHIHLGFQDASFRKKTAAIGLLKYFSGLVPEVNHIYPVYRFNIISGKISKNDSFMMAEIEEKLRLIAESKGKCQAFCPVGTGGHVDHIIVRDICKKAFRNSVFWEDFPYNLELKEEADFGSFAKLGALSDAAIQEQKIKIISLYKSQIQPMFPCGINLLPEKYYRETAE